MADRSLEFRGIVNILNPSIFSSSSQSQSISITTQSSSVFLATAHKLSLKIDANEKIVTQLEQLAKRKEARNGNSSEVSDLSSAFTEGMTMAKADMESLKRLSSSQGKAVKSKQHADHYDSLLTSLGDRLRKLSQPFQTALKQHQIQLRSVGDRVAKYGGTGGQQGGVMKSAQQFAMFSGNVDSSLRRRNQNSGYSGNVNGNSTASNSSHPQSSNSKIISYSDNSSNSSNSSLMVESDEYYEKTKKKPAPYVNVPSTHASPYNDSGLSSMSGGGGGGGMLRMGLQNRYRQEAKQDQASKIEATIAQMGEMFQQLASLVAEQSEQIASIEGNVEDGLENSKEAHASMVSFYEITKGNRSLILKLFAILIFCIILFLVKWR